MESLTFTHGIRKVSCEILFFIKSLLTVERFYFCDVHELSETIAYSNENSLNLDMKVVRRALLALLLLLLKYLNFKTKLNHLLRKIRV